MLLDISEALNAATGLLRPSGARDAPALKSLRDELRRDARNPNVLGDQRDRAFRLATQLDLALAAIKSS